ncbi:MAG: hypothetical protein KI792_06875 [Alphaproteobacteria bacterium]|nr:hypothetical protein [Alphaproteobacteria bacterium SS10]
MRAAILAVVLAVMLAGGGVAFYVSPVIAASSDDAKATEAEAVGEGLLGPTGPAFVQLPLMRVPVVHRQRTVQFLEIDMMIEVEDTSVAAEYEENMKYLQHEVIQSLYGQFDRTVGADGAAVQTLRLKRKVASAVASVMGRETVKDVLIQNIRHRRI